MALIDEDQQDAVKAFFDKLSDFYIKLLGRYLDVFPQIDGFCIHDDWGSQRETFFAPDVCEEMIVPYMRKVNDYLHSRGRFTDLHSCGMALKQVPNMIKAGWDCWQPQTMNDVHKIYELYGDKIIVAAIPDLFDPKTATEEEQRASARKFAEEYCDPDKPTYLNFAAMQVLTPAFREEIYRQSRIRYGG
jgi:uroporphyrinogen-III decarboxylase